MVLENCLDVAQTSSVSEIDCHFAVNGNVPSIEEKNVCIHWNKTSLFNMASVRKKLKNSRINTLTRACVECSRSGATEQEDTKCLCASCGYFGCEKHVAKHCKDVGNGMGHAICMSIKQESFRCMRCEKDIDAENENSPAKKFLINFKSYTKMRSVSTNKINSQRSSCTAVNLSKSSEALVDGMKSVKIEADSTNNANKKKSDRNKTSSQKKYFLPPVKGLPNLGNTCFFNSIMQCMMQTHSMYTYVNTIESINHINLPSLSMQYEGKPFKISSITLTADKFVGSINDTFISFHQAFTAGSSLQPRALIRAIGQKALRFGDHKQEDAHELFQYFIEGLSSEEIAWRKSVINDYLDSNGAQFQFPTMNHREAVGKELLNSCGRSLIDAIFGGTLIQTITCSNCGYISLTYEPFHDLSLPMATTVNTIHKSASSNFTRQSRKKGKRARRKSVEKANRSLTEECSYACDDDDGNDRDPIDVSIDLSSEEPGEISVLDKMQISDQEHEHCALPLRYLRDNECLPGSLEFFLNAFVQSEILSGHEAYACEKCCLGSSNKRIKKTAEASKRYLIYEPPQVLTLHFKRFLKAFSPRKIPNFQKIGGHILFPRILDIAPFCSRNAKMVTQKKVLYSLYAVVCHYGTLFSGHYVSYVRQRPFNTNSATFLHNATSQVFERREEIEESGETESEELECEASTGTWYYTSDSCVSTVPISRVLNDEAYLLFYERLH